MTTLDPQLVEQQVQQIETTDAVILRDVRHFPTVHSVTLPKSVIVIVHSGDADVTFDHSKLHLEKDNIGIFSGKHIFSGLRTSEDFTATLVIFGDKLIEDARLTSFGYRFQEYHVKPTTILNEPQVKQLLLVISLMEAILTQKEPDLPHRHDALCNTIHIFFEFLNAFRDAKKSDMDTSLRGSHVFVKFMDLLAEHYVKEHKVNFYAEKLCLTPKYMSKLIHDATGCGANAWIDQYIIAKAKLLLISRKDLSVQAISQMLGFQEQASFTRFFRNIENLSPREFRQHNAK